MRIVALALSLFSALAAAEKTHTFDWKVSWKKVNPDGLHERPVVAINDQFPMPVISIPKGDRLVINLDNQLDEPKRNVSLHFHGIYQEGTPDMDGPIQLAQCPQPVNSTFVYNFTVDQPGTYWYHAHVDDLYPDGYRQAFLVTDDEPYFEDQVEEELAFTLADWYHQLYAVIRDTEFMSLYNPTGAEPVPNSLLWNDTTNFAAQIKPDTTYRLRIVNTAAFSAFYWFIEGQNFTVVEADGVFVDPYPASTLLLNAGQRYSVLFKTPKNATAVYRMGQVADVTLYDYIPSDLKLNQTGWLYTSEDHKHFEELSVEDIYNAVPHGDAKLKHFSSEDIEAMYDMDLVPYDRMKVLPDPDREITLKITMTNLIDGKNYAFFNNMSYVEPKVPTLYTVLSAPDDETASNETIYGTNTNTYVVEHDDIVQLVINNFDGGSHPFHLHGHAFQVLVRAPSINGGETEDDYNPWNPKKPHKFAKHPLRRDVVRVEPYSHAVLRWKADNPGVWIFHCHVEWHLTQGLAIQFVEAPIQIRQNVKISQNHLDVCKQAGIPVQGNAAANDKDFFDLAGQYLQPKYLPDGFTARGYIALAMSTLMAFVGIGFLIWYSVVDTPDDVYEAIETITQE